MLDALSVVTPRPLIVTEPPPSGALIVTGFATLLLNVKALLDSVPAPLIVPAETLTAPTASALLMASMPPFTVSVLVVGIVLTAPTSRVPDVTVVLPVYVFVPDKVVVPDPFWTSAVVPPPLGVPKGALTMICELAVLLKLKLALDKVAVPVIEPLDAVTVPTVLLAFICKVPPLITTGTPTGIAFVAPIIKVPDSTLTGPLKEFEVPLRVVDPAPFCVTEPPPREAVTVIFPDPPAAFVKIKLFELKVPVPVMDPPEIVTVPA